MSPKPYKRKQGDLELRILKDGRLVMVAPDETLMEIAQALEVIGAGDEAPGAQPSANDDLKQQHLENHDGETRAPGRE